MLRLFGIFIVRSGLLKSVHSFAQDTERGVMLGVIFFMYTIYGILQCFYGIKQTQKIAKQHKIVSVIFTSNWIFISCLLIILLSILYQLLHEVIYNISY